MPGDAYFIVWNAGDKSHEDGVTATRLRTVLPSSFGDGAWPSFRGNDCCFEIHASFKIEN
jgi:hypothetical protein